MRPGMAILSLCLFRVGGDTSANTLNRIALNQAADRYRPGNLYVINKHLDIKRARLSGTVTELLVGRL